MKLPWPFHSMPDELLQTILDRHQLTDKEKADILAFSKQEQERFETSLKTTSSFVEIAPELTQAQFTVCPLHLDLTNGFYPNITYTYEEYCHHLEHLRNISHPCYRLILKENRPFQNMKVTLKSRKYAIFSKENNPVIHIVLRHPQMIQAIESYCQSLI